MRSEASPMSADPRLPDALPEQSERPGNRKSPTHEVRRPVEERDPLAHKRAQMEAVRRDINTALEQLTEAAQRKEWERYAALREAFVDKAGELIVLADAWGRADPAIARQVAEEVGLFYRRISEQLDSLRTREESESTELPTGTQPAARAKVRLEHAAPSGTAEARVLPAWEQEFFREFPGAAKALGMELTGTRATRAFRHESPLAPPVESLATPPEMGWEQKPELSGILVQVSRTFDQWFAANRTTAKEYDQSRFVDLEMLDQNKIADKNVRHPSPRSLELYSPVLVLYEGVKSLRDALRAENLRQIQHVVERLRGMAPVIAFNQGRFGWRSRLPFLHAGKLKKIEQRLIAQLSDLLTATENMDAVKQYVRGSQGKESTPRAKAA